MKAKDTARAAATEAFHLASCRTLTSGTAFFVLRQWRGKMQGFDEHKENNVNKKTFKDIKVTFSESDYSVICSSFDEVLNLIPDEDFDPIDYGYTQREINDFKAPQSEFEHDMWNCFKDFERTPEGYVTTGTNYLLLCDLLGQMLDRYSFVMYEVGEFEVGDGDNAEDLTCICDAISIVLQNPAFFECKSLARKLKK